MGISFVVPVWNVAPHLLEKCVASIVAVAGKSDDILICNDGSEVALTKQYRAICSDERFTFLDSPTHRGMAVMRNWGAMRARAKYLFFVDADDELELFNMRELQQILYKEPVVVMANHKHMSFDMSEVLSDRKKQIYFDLFENYSGTINDPFLFATFLFHPMIFATAEFIAAAGFSLAFTSGEEIALEIILTEANPDRFLHWDKSVYLYRKNPDSVVHSADLYEGLIKNIENIISIEATRRLGRKVKACRAGRSRKTGAAHYRLTDYTGQEILPPWLDASFEIV